jgi:cbb3-type cytochrome oxidase subunit 3
MDFFINLAVVAAWFSVLFLGMMLLVWLAGLPRRRRERRDEARRRETLGG